MPRPCLYQCCTDKSDFPISCRALPGEWQLPSFPLPCNSANKKAGPRLTLSKLYWASWCCLKWLIVHHSALTSAVECHNFRWTVHLNCDLSAGAISAIKANRQWSQGRLVRYTSIYGNMLRKFQTSVCLFNRFNRAGIRRSLGWNQQHNACGNWDILRHIEFLISVSSGCDRRLKHWSNYCGSIRRLGRSGIS